MRCPFCHSEQLIVLNSRPTNSNLEIWRRRKCLSCGELITTHEKIDLSCMIVIKRDGRRIKFNRAKLYSGIYHAISNAKKIDRGSAGALAEKIMTSIEEKILSQKSKIITSIKIFEITSNILKDSYPDSYLRYIAYFSRPEELKKLGADAPSFNFR